MCVGQTAEITDQFVGPISTMHPSGALSLDRGFKNAVKAIDYCCLGRGGEMLGRESQGAPPA
jgi:hypothetical protein